MPCSHICDANTYNPYSNYVFRSFDKMSGFYYTKNSPFEMATSYNNSYFLDMFPEGLYNATKFGLVPFYSEVILHDPHYFTINKNPLAIPKRMIPRLEEISEITNLLIYLEVSKITQMNLPDNPCNEEQEKNFISCIGLYHIQVG